MPIRRIGYACPICDRTGVTSHLCEAPPALATFCETNPEHKWTDSMELRMQQPRMLALPKPAAQTIARLPLTLQLPEQLMKNLQARYGDALSDNLIGVLQYCAQPDYLLIGCDDLERLQEKLGARIDNGSELYGAIFRMSEEIVALKTQIKSLQRNQTVRATGTGVLLDMGDFLPKAVGRAQEIGMEVDEYLGAYLRDAVANDWVVV